MSGTDSITRDRLLTDFESGYLRVLFILFPALAFLSYGALNAEVPGAGALFATGMVLLSVQVLLLLLRRFHHGAAVKTGLYIGITALTGLFFAWLELSFLPAVESPAFHSLTIIFTLLVFIWGTVDMGALPAAYTALVLPWGFALCYFFVFRMYELDFNAIGFLIFLLLPVLFLRLRSRYRQLRDGFSSGI